MQHSSAFSLIELMVVVAIIAVLGTFAIPAYQTYTVRTRVAEAISSVRPLQLKLADNTYNGLPFLSGVSDPLCTSPANAPCTDPSKPTQFSKYVDHVYIGIPGNILIYFKGHPEIDGKTLLLVPKARNSNNLVEFLAYDFSLPTSIPLGRISFVVVSLAIARAYRLRGTGPAAPQIQQAQSDGGVAPSQANTHPQTAPKSP